MATAARPQKPARKGTAEPARRASAWSTAARASPTFSPSSGSPRPQVATASTNSTPFPPLSQQNGNRPEDKVLQSLSGLTGTTVTLLTKTAQRYEGVVGSTNAEGDTSGVTLKDVKEITNPGAPLKEQLFIASTNIDSWSSGPADAKAPNGDTFRTDTDISQKKGAGRERELKAWQPNAETPETAVGQGDDVTFGPGSNNATWDQFAVNEKLFGVKTNFDEDIYTTKLDRSAADFKERERKAQRLANEIIGAVTNNPHIAEERNLVVDDSGVNEEDKYGAVVRGTNAYVPPGARKPGTIVPATNNNTTKVEPKPEIPKVSVNAPDGAAVVPPGHSPASSKASSPAPPSHAKPPADAVPAFRDFVVNERQRLTQKRQALVKSEMDKRITELVKFSQNFKLNKPIPDDLVPILAKDEDKQKAIMEKATKDATSAQARSIGTAAVAPNATRGPIPNAKISPEARKVAQVVTKPTPSNGVPAQKVAVPTKTATTPEVVVKAKPTINMSIQPIPPFKGAKARQTSTPATGTATTPNGGAVPNLPSSGSNPTVSAVPVSPKTAANNRLNANASSFRPNPKANAFTPGSASPSQSTSNQSLASASASPKPRPETVQHNPFFGVRPTKKSTPVTIKDDFNPFKHNKVVDASQVTPMWPYSGKRYIQIFPVQPHHPQQQSSHMIPPVPPPMPPPSYEEDSAAQAAAARGYVYAYPPYSYPAQMMPGMAPPPPGTYMSGPYMQPMAYPGMPPPGTMYASPGMGQMPPPQGYMQPPPPPGAYPPQLNGGGPRPSMPPTPIPTHTHPYYHQSPQLQHAVPYPMMMPPPPPQGVPPHPYEGGPAPPVQMGGHA